ncbi:E3 ubiquitin-protein ligase RFWD3 [Bombyx mori]|uniref:RING-type E3 ubiquitin transferase n=1 Tax=Bombyx mori TaxID=7091 RepID=A0A8R2AFD2_BOMMO|nr:E3 ubiquitin-protein ligase RFWD3 [Bombyx mori]
MSQYPTAQSQGTESPGSPNIFEEPEQSFAAAENDNHIDLPSTSRSHDHDPSEGPLDVPSDEPIQIDLAGPLRYDNDDSNDTVLNIIINGPGHLPAQSEDSNLTSPLTSFSDESTRQSINEDSNSCASIRLNPRPPDDIEPPAKLRKMNEVEEVDGETCPICLDSWGNSGDHRLVALRCGHLFGSECVERWLKAQKLKDRTCPTCKGKANLKDLRFIYARRLVAADTSQITALQKQVEILQSEKSRTELELEKMKIAHRACVQQLEGLRSTLMKSQSNKEQPSRKSWRFALEKNLEICKDGGCRVLTYNCRTYELYVSQKSVNYLFPGFGIRKISCVDYKLGQFVHLHPKPIRDITYSQHRDLLLSVALDSTARIVERGILSVTVNSGMPLWSCSWDNLRSNEFYVGGVGGVIHHYDVRNPSTYLRMLSSPGDLSPVVSLCSTEYGLLSCQLNSSKLWAVNTRQCEPRVLPVEGSFMSLAYDNASQRAVIASRPSSNGLERSKLSVCKLKPSIPNGEVICDVVETFSGSLRSSLMSKVAWVRLASSAWVAAHSESDSALYLHGVDGTRTMSLPASEPALDVCSVETNGSNILAALSESRLRLYKAVPTNT